MCSVIIPMQVISRAICEFPYPSAIKGRPLGPSWMACSIPNIVTDVVLICLPVPVIWKNQIQRTHKISLTAVFASGSLYVVHSFCSFQTFSLCTKIKF